MKHLNLFKPILLAIAVLFAAIPLQAQMVSNNNDDEVNKVDPSVARNAYRPGEVIVKFKETSAVQMRCKAGKFQTSGLSKVDKVLNYLGVNEADQLMPLTGNKVYRSVMRSYSGEEIKDRDLSGLYRLRMDNANITVDEAVTRLKELEEVDYAEPNYLVFTMSTDADTYTAEPLYTEQWGPAAINLDQLWAMPKLEGAERPVIAILDTGIDITHPDLEANIWTNPAESTGAEGEDDDNNGFADDVHGWDFINQTAKIADYNGHGTHCAGIAAAVGDNGIGITGANPDAYIMPITVMQSDGTGDVATIIKGIDYATDNGASFLSMSFGSYAYSIAQEQALAKAYSKATLVAAAGNDHRCIYTGHHKIGPGPCYPAAFTFVLGVEAANEGGIAGFSNWDCDGPIYSMPWGDNNEETLHNYELRAPGVNIFSTYPQGRYKSMNGTSMACPLAAGAISRLMQSKSYEYQVINREILFGDLIHVANQQTGIMDIMAAYNIKDEDRVPTLWLVSTELNDQAEGDGDFRPDAGEIIDLWPTIRNDWGNATNIRLHLEMGDELEDASLIEFITNDVDFGKNLSGYGKAKSDNPIRFKIADNCPDNRHIKLKFTATCDNITEPIEQNFVIVVENGIELGGVINEDLTLYPDKHYIVTRSIAIPKGKTLTIMPGTRLEFYQDCYLYSEGKLVSKGMPDNPIIFTKHNNSDWWGGVRSSSIEDNIVVNNVYIHTHPCDTISYCIMDYVNYSGSHADIYMKDCQLRYLMGDNLELFWQAASSDDDIYIYCALKGERVNFLNSSPDQLLRTTFKSKYTLKNSNFVNFLFNDFDNWRYSQLRSSNLINTYNTGLSNCVVGRNDGIATDHAEWPSWLGTGKEEIIRPYIYDSMNPLVDCFTTVDLSNMPTRPYKEAHGIVWKVVVDGYDAQDEFDQLPPLGVGRHKFEVYYNRDDMDTTFTPTITMGVRPPYTQIGIAEDGFWSVKDSVSVYTAYLSITGKLQADGLNRIKVTGGKDYDHFDIPEESYRFNVLVQAAGSMATGFAAEAGMGNVKLTWNNENNDFEDAMGFNVYRYTEEEKLMPVYDEWGNEVWDYDENGNWVPKLEMQTVRDTVRLNQMILDLDTEQFTDYEVTPGETYYYYYKVLSTDLKEYDISNVVAATPLTSTLGDANASGEVDVADVITTVNYAAGMEPRPFIFEAADVNVDTEIDILDVIGIIRIITSPDAAPATASIESVAEYWVKDGVVWLETPVDIAGVQVSLDAPQGSSITPTEDLNGFEKVSKWLADNDYLFLAYNMAGRTISAGRHPILNIGANEIADIRLSDTYGHNVMATPSIVTAVENINADGKRAVPQGIYDMMGRKISTKASDLNRLPHGIYIVNGVKVVK